MKDSLFEGFKGYFHYDTSESKEYRKANLRVAKSDDFQDISEIANWYTNSFYASGILEKLKSDVENRENGFQIVEHNIRTLKQKDYINDKNYFISLLRNFGQIYFPKYSGEVIETLAAKERCK